MRAAPRTGHTGGSRLQVDARQRPRRLHALAGGPRLALASGRRGPCLRGTTGVVPIGLDQRALVCLGCLGAKQRYNLVQPRVPDPPNDFVVLERGAAPTCRPPGRRRSAAFGIVVFPRLARVDAVVGQAPLAAIRGHLAATHRRNPRDAKSESERNYSSHKNGAHVPSPRPRMIGSRLGGGKTDWRSQRIDLPNQNARGTDTISLRLRAG
jgi:hypothetical protein